MSNGTAIKACCVSCGAELWEAFYVNTDGPKCARCVSRDAGHERDELLNRLEAYRDMDYLRAVLSSGGGESFGELLDETAAFIRNS